MGYVYIYMFDSWDVLFFVFYYFVLTLCFVVIVVLQRTLELDSV